MNKFIDRNEPQNQYWKNFLNDDMEIDFNAVGKYIKQELDKNLSFMGEKNKSLESNENIEKKTILLNIKSLKLLDVLSYKFN